MGFAEAIRSGLSNYFTFRGRASRSEYWYFVLFIVICALPAALVDLAIGRPIFQAIVALTTFIPHKQVVRCPRHWTQWLVLLDCAGPTRWAVLLIYWLCKAGTTQIPPIWRLALGRLSSGVGRDGVTAGVSRRHSGRVC
jgi:uncharacterized membrane protein YhaH (DUF805 family)